MKYNEAFLRELDKERNRIVYARITALKTDESPIQTIEGRVTQGSISIDGSSAVRRTCSLTMVAQDIDINEYYWGYKTKFKLAIGLQNLINPNYPNIIWFEQGIYVITQFNCSIATNNYTINLQGKDKMCLLNGEVGGILNVPTCFDKVEDEMPDGTWKVTKFPIRDIIRDSVHQYGGEPFHNIVINDVDDLGLELLEYRFDDPLFLFRYANEDTYFNGVFDPNMPCWLADGTPSSIGAKNKDNEYIHTYDSLISSLTEIDEPTEVYLTSDRTKAVCIAKIEYGDTAGYRLTDLIYPNDLIGNVGEALTTVLDKIKKMLGNFEYFYDIDGRFVFQREKTYINTVWTPSIEVEDGENYIDGMEYSDSSAYTFSGSELITSFNNSPDMKNIRNDFSAWGVRKGLGGGADIPIHMRYAIDEKPVYYKNYDGEVFTVDPNLIVYKKQPLPNGLSDDWWEVRDWAEYYKILTGTYPQGVLNNYKTETTSLDLMSLFPGGVSWNKDRKDLAIFDVSEDGKLVYAGHNPTCSHDYLWFVDQANSKGYYTYFYKPTIPSAVVTNDQYDWREIIYQMQKDYRKNNHENDFAVRISQNNPTYYPTGQTGYEHYYIDIEGFWRDLYYTPKAYQETLNKKQEKIDFVASEMATANSNKDEELLKQLETRKKSLEKERDDFKEYYEKTFYTDTNHPRRFWNKAVYESPQLLNYWFDFLDADGELNQFSVKMIGNRPKSINDSNIKSIYFRDTPAIIFASAEDMKNREPDTGYRYFQVVGMDNMFSISAQGKSAKDEIDSLLYNHSYTTESITINAIPIYYLEPNTRIYISDNNTGIEGDYIISKMSIPLSYNGTMTINATKAPEILI